MTEKLLVRCSAKPTNDLDRLARLGDEYKAEREKLRQDWVLAMVYWEQCTEDGFLPMRVKEVSAVLSEAGWHRTLHFFANAAAELSKDGIVKVTCGRDGMPFEVYL